MAATLALTWVILFSACHVFGQSLDSMPFENNGVCSKMICNTLEKLNELKNCMVVVGNLQVSLLEKTKRDDFEGISFNLREVTGYVVFYRVIGLESIGQLFPNLTRIRGAQLLNDYSLIVYDMPNLKEIGLYSLLRIDRGGIIVWAAPQACYLNTINWKIIAPRSRHVLGSSDVKMQCVSTCRCTSDVETNYCWNYKKCQRYVEGPEADKCSEQCLGCKKTNGNSCSVCRNYTYKGRCLSKCPNNTLLLSMNKYCLDKEECSHLKGWPWNNTCVFDCPLGYVVSNISNNISCRLCPKCHKTCNSLVIQATSAIQAAQRCVYINGSLTVHIRAIPEAMDELRTYLGQIEEVSDFIVIYGSLVITSLEFLSSLRYIGGRNLKDNKYSLVVDGMVNLQSLFTPNVTNNLKIGRGALNFSRNPVLCINHIEQLNRLFPVKPDNSDLLHSNGYSGGCKYASVGLQIRVVNESSALVMFTPMEEPDVHYTILYIRLPIGSHKMFVPETCSDSEWHAINVPIHFGKNGLVELTSLRPASTYALCIESYDAPRKYLARSTIFNFTTPVGKPEPPFISELVANSSTLVVLRWVDHKVYRPHITRYEIDLTIIDINLKNVGIRNHCKDDNIPEIDHFRHAVVMRPPSDYDRSCESMCGVLSTVTAGALVEDYLDFCSDEDSDCNIDEEKAPTNTTLGRFVRTMFLNISGPQNDFQIGGLAPYRDYRFRLRACVGDICSRSARSVVRTLYSDYADVPKLTYANANDDGEISVKWKPPDFVNGIVLSYSVQVLIPKITETDDIEFSPNVWCVAAEKFNLVVKYIVTKKYYVRVCSSSLAQSNACGEWKTVIAVTEYTQNWWFAVLFGLLLFITSIAVCVYCKKRDNTDQVPLIDMTPTYNMTDSEPPFMLSDLVPLSVFVDHNNYTM